MLFAGVLGWTAFGQADRDSNGAVVNGGSVDAMSIAVGDCLNDELGAEGEDELVAESYELSLMYFYPSAETWDALEHREALCGVSSASGMSESLLLGSAG